MNYLFDPFLLTPPLSAVPPRPSNYFKLPVIQSKYLRAIGNYSRRTPSSHLQYTLNIEPIPIIIHRLTAKFFAHYP